MFNKSTVETRQELFNVLNLTKTSLAVFDNEGKTLDRYSIYFYPKEGTPYAITASEKPDVQGVWQHTDFVGEPTEDKRLKIPELPETLARKIIEELRTN